MKSLSVAAIAAVLVGAGLMSASPTPQQQPEPVTLMAMSGPNIPAPELGPFSPRPADTLPPEPELDQLAEMVADLVAAMKDTPASTFVASAPKIDAKATAVEKVVTYATGGGSTGNVVAYASGPNIPDVGGGSNGGVVRSYNYQPAWGTTVQYAQPRVQVQRAAPVATFRTNSLFRRARRCTARGCSL